MFSVKSEQVRADIMGARSDELRIDESDELRMMSYLWHQSLLINRLSERAQNLKSSLIRAKKNDELTWMSLMS